MSESTASPLLEAQTDSLDELFNRDPLKLSDQDIGTVVAKLRAGRAKWAQKEAEGDKAPPKPKAPKKTAAQILREPVDPGTIVGLEDLGL